VQQILPIDRIKIFCDGVLTRIVTVIAKAISLHWRISHCRVSQVSHSSLTDVSSYYDTLPDRLVTEKSMCHAVVKLNV